MTSIFHGSFLDNIKRLKAAEKNELQPKKAEIKSDETFNHFLSQAEESVNQADFSEKISLETNGIKEDNLKSPLIFTNNIDPPLTNFQVQSSLATVEELTSRPNLSAKNLDLSVKKISAQHVAPPPEPQLISAQRKVYHNYYTEGQVALRDINSVSKSTTQKGTTNNSSPTTDQIKQAIKTAGKLHGVDPVLSLAIAQAESSLNHRAVSKDGHSTKGIFQLLDSTAKQMLSTYGLKKRYDPFDPALNAYLGVGYLRRLHDIFSVETHLTSKMKTFPAKTAEDLEKLAVAAYNTGEGNVVKAQNKTRRLGKDPTDFLAVAEHLPTSTRTYVARVTQLRAALIRDQVDQNSKDDLA